MPWIVSTTKTEKTKQVTACNRPTVIILYPSQYETLGETLLLDDPVFPVVHLFLFLSFFVAVLGKECLSASSVTLKLNYRSLGRFFFFFCDMLTCV